MIDHYTIKFGPAVGQKELEKALHEGGEPHPHLHKMKARIEVVGDFEALKKLADTLKELSNSQ